MRRLRRASLHLLRTPIEGAVGNSANRMPIRHPHVHRRKAPSVLVGRFVSRDFDQRNHILAPPAGRLKVSLPLLMFAKSPEPTVSVNAPRQSNAGQALASSVSR